MTDYFTTSPDWATYAAENGIDLAEKSESIPLTSIIASTLDIPAQRATQVKDKATWVESHALSLVGYRYHEIQVVVRDGARVGVKISWPITEPSETAGSVSLPVVVVTHGGGWVQGTHHTEERWILWPLFKHFKFISISIDYRLAPEHPFPTWHNDSFDVLQKVFIEPNLFLTDAVVKLDLEKVILAGSSAGAGTAAVMARQCRDQGLKIRGVILNVPVLCDYRQLPQQQIRTLTYNEVLSYEQCTGAALSSGVMVAVWDLVLPSTN